VYVANGNTLTDASSKSHTWDFENPVAQMTMQNSGGTVKVNVDYFLELSLQPSASPKLQALV
jgi:hypothetical protein